MFMTLMAKYARNKAADKMKFLEEKIESEEDIYEWRIWVENVFMPANRRLQDLIVTQAHLIREKEVPQCLLKFIAHASEFETIVKKWEKKDFSEAKPGFEFPVELREYAEKSYLELKKEQVKLLGKH